MFAVYQRTEKLWLKWPFIISFIFEAASGGNHLFNQFIRNAAENLWPSMLFCTLWHIQDKSSYLIISTIFRFFLVFPKFLQELSEFLFYSFASCHIILKQFMYYIYIYYLPYINKTDFIFHIPIKHFTKYMNLDTNSNHIKYTWHSKCKLWIQYCTGVWEIPACVNGVRSIETDKWQLIAPVCLYTTGDNVKLNWSRTRTHSPSHDNAQCAPKFPGLKQ